MSFRCLFMYNKQSSSVIIGLCIGIALSLIRTPFIEDDCSTFEKNTFENGKFPSSRDLRSNELNPEDDYEPKVIIESNFDGNIRNPQPKVAKLIRPRYYSTELGIREKLFVAVLSSRETFGSFGASVNKTLGNHVDKVIFFIDGIGSASLNTTIPVVGFKDYKPLIKLFRALLYISENYIEEYDYFFIITDHTYIHGRRLMSLVKKLSISQDVHMGALSDQPGSLYCSIESGVLLSQNILEQIIEHLNWCTRTTYSEFDTDNFGRCILHATNKPCSATLQGQTFSSYHLRDVRDITSHLQLIGATSLIKESVTVSGVTNPKDIYKLHMFYSQEDLKEVKVSIEVAKENVIKSRPFVPQDNCAEQWPIGSAPSHKPPTRFDVLLWDNFNATHIFLPDDLQNVQLMHGADYLDIMGVVNASIAHLRVKYKGRLEYKGVEYGHRKFDPTRGIDYLLSLSFKDTSTGLTISKKLEASRGLTEPEIIPMPYMTESNRIIIVVPVKGSERNQAIQFIKWIEFETKLSNVVIMFGLLYPSDSSFQTNNPDYFKGLKEESHKFNRNHKDVDIKASWVNLNLLNKDLSDFALVDLTVKQFKPDTLIFLTRLNARFMPDCLNRVRMNTIEGWQIFSLVPFTQYHPDVIDDSSTYHKMDVNRNTGHFDRYNTDHIGFFVRDYLKARGSIESIIPIIHKDDELKLDHMDKYEYDIYGMFIRTTKLHILRATEPTLKVSYVPISCSHISSSNKYRKQLCTSKQQSSLGLRTQLSKLVIEYEDSLNNKH